MMIVKWKTPIKKKYNIKKCGAYKQVNVVFVIFIKRIWRLFRGKKTTLIKTLILLVNKSSVQWSKLTVSGNRRCASHDLHNFNKSRFSNNVFVHTCPPVCTCCACMCVYTLVCLWLILTFKLFIRFSFLIFQLGSVGE